MTRQDFTPTVDRRTFMRAGGVAAVAALAAGKLATAQDAAAPLKVGLIGCGGRGTGALRNALLADEGAICWALGDAFEDMARESLANIKKERRVVDRVQVDDSRIFTGLDAYKGVIECCDVVILATPPGFRPIHLAAVAEAGKHCFCEKPVAVDGPGIRAVLEASRIMREKKVNLVSGLCYRYEHKKQETLRRIHEGAIGEITAVECVYNTGSLWHKGRNPEWSELDYQLRNWLYFDWLSGDHIAEQHIHSLDKMLWVMGNKPPVKAWASGGRTVRTDEKFGNIYDHFNTVFEWENGVKGFSSCRQWENASTAVYDNAYGTTGVAKVQEHTILDRNGNAVWKWESQEQDDMYQNELDALFAAIREGRHIDNSQYMIDSNIMAIMGRAAAYSGQLVTYQQVLESEVALFPSMEDLRAGRVPNRPVPVPGKGQYI